MSILILNTIYKPKILFKKKIFICQIGKKGKTLKHLKREGDKSTPIGNWRIEKIFYERDKNLNLKIKKSLSDKVVYVKKIFFGVMTQIVVFIINYLNVITQKL